MAENSVFDRVGHGPLGLRSNLKTFADFMEETANRKDVLCDLMPGMIVTGWSIDQGATYVAPVELTIDSLRVDVVSVRTLLDSGLTRAESLALCRSTEGTFYYDPDEEFQDPFVWDSDDWDDGTSRYDQFARLYVHLNDDADPSTTSVSANFGFHYATRGMVQPDLGPNKLTNPSLDTWSAGSPTGWILSGTGTSTEETSIVHHGSSSIKLVATGAGVFARVRQEVTMEAGKRYRISGSYYIDESTGPNCVLSVLLSDAISTWISTDGRSTGGAETALSGRVGEWRRFVFDFICPAFATKLLLFTATGAAAETVTAYVDDVRLQRIWRFNYYEPRISSSDIPSTDTGSNDIYFGGKRVGLGAISLNNADGRLEKTIGQLEWLNHEVYLTVGGETMDGQEILADDMRRQFTGLVQSYDVGDSAASFDLQDSRVFFHIKLPLSTYRETDFPSMDPRLVGGPRPIWFGAKENITPSRIDLETTFSKYGIYELADCTNAPNGIKQITVILAYPDETAAAERDTTRALQLSAGTHYTEDLANGRFTITKDVGPYEVTAENRKINFNIGAGELTATLSNGMYTAAGLAAHIATQMTSAAATTISCSYSESTNLFTISKGAGTLQLLCSTGVNKEISAYSLIGFDRGANKTGSLSYAGDEATFTDVDTDHVIRVDGQGFKDTAAGRYTGTADAMIQVGADICQVLIEKYLRKPYSVIDQESFVFARERAPEALAIYLNEFTTTKEIFDTLEFSNVANIVIDGTGMIYYKVYVGDVPDGITELVDRDYLPNGFTGSRSVADVYRAVVVQYDKDPSTGKYAAAADSDTSVELRFGRTEQREFETYVKIGDNAASLATRLLTLAKRPARKIRILTKSKLVDSEVGDKIKLTRKRAMDANGQINGGVFRIISIKKSPLEGRVEAEVVDDVITVAGIQCVTACQLVCELTTQTACAVACQEACQLNGCQTGCEATCQGCGQGVCQTTCEATTQTACSTGCQVACQKTCQRNCQSCGQAGQCQTSCETSCQGCGQTTCQESCQLNCQTGCQLGCQSACQGVCQVASEYYPY